MKYGELPKLLGEYKVSCKEMMFYQYLPIKLIGESDLISEKRLECFHDIIGAACCDFIGEFGLDRYMQSYVYVSAKYLFQSSGCSFNRDGWHSDGFMTDDINYIWCDKYPTIFNNSSFDLSMDDSLSLQQMIKQALPENNIVYSKNELIRLNQFNIHKVAPVENSGMRTFLKISISKDKYDLIGNSKNYELDYNWDMKPRKVERNIPQSNVT